MAILSLKAVNEDSPRDSLSSVELLLKKKKKEEKTFCLAMKRVAIAFFENFAFYFPNKSHPILSQHLIVWKRVEMLK